MKNLRLPLIIYVSVIALDRLLASHFGSFSFLSHETIQNFGFYWTAVFNIIFTLLSLIPSWLVFLFVVISVHRSVLLKREITFDKGLVKVFLNFAWKSFIIGFWLTIFTSPIFAAWISIDVLETSVSLLLTTLSVVWFVFGMYLVSRWSLVLPASAIGSPISIPKSWHLSSQHVLLMVGVAGVVPTVVTLISISAFRILELGTLTTFVLSHVLGLLFMIFEITCLSLAYYLVMKKQIVTREY